MEIDTVDLMDVEINPTRALEEAQSIHASKLPNGETIFRTLPIARENIQPIPISYRDIEITDVPEGADEVARVALPILSDRSIEQLLDDRDGIATELVNVLAEAETTDEPPLNFLSKVSKLIQELLHLTHLISERDRTRTEEMKLKYHKLTDQAGDTLRSKGFTTVIVAIVGLGVNLGALGFSNAEDRNLVQELGKQVPQLASMFTSDQDRRISHANDEKSLLNTEILALQQNTQSNLKEQLFSLHEAVKQWMAKASNSN
jgi:hypothetical protein